MTRFFTVIRILTTAVLLLTATIAADAKNVLNSRYGVLEAPDGFVYNHELSESSGLEVYATGDKTKAIAFGCEPNDKDISVGSIAAVMANMMGINGSVRKLRGRDGVAICAVTDPSDGKIFALAGNKTDEFYTIIIVYGSGDNPEKVYSYLKSFRKK